MASAQTCSAVSVESSFDLPFFASIV